jgi:hypothetical protein
VAGWDCQSLLQKRACIFELFFPSHTPCTTQKTLRRNTRHSTSAIRNSPSYKTANSFQPNQLQPSSPSSQNIPHPQPQQLQRVNHLTRSPTPHLHFPQSTQLLPVASALLLHSKQALSSSSTAHRTLRTAHHTFIHLQRRQHGQAKHRHRDNHHHALRCPRHHSLRHLCDPEPGLVLCAKKQGRRGGSSRRLIAVGDRLESTTAASPRSWGLACDGARTTSELYIYRYHVDRH